MSFSNLLEQQNKNKHNDDVSEKKYHQRNVKYVLKC